MVDFILYADDTNILFSDRELPNLEKKLENVISSTSNWFKQKQLVLNADKTNFMHFKTSKSLKNFDTDLKNSDIKQATEVKFLGITITSNLTWKSHIEQIARKIKPGIAMLYKIRNIVDTHTLLRIYYALIQSHLNYGILVWGGAPQYMIDILLKLQKKAIRIIARKNRYTPCRPLFKKYKILTVPSLYILASSCYAKQTIQYNPNTDESRQLMRIVNDIHSHNTRHKHNIFLPNTSNSRRRLDTLFNCCVIHNKLPAALKQITNHKQFKTALKRYLVENVIYKVKEVQ